MVAQRRITHIIKAVPTLEGAGVRLKRAFGFHQVPKLDPFLLLDDFHSDTPEDYLAGFPWHPHRGIETITYVLRGEVEHADSMGNRGVIGEGDVQWMTAGSGVIHQEMPKGDAEGNLCGFQLWANLPASHKMMDPRYRGIRSARIPEIRLGGGVRVRIICGSMNGITGPVRGIVTNPEYLDVSIPAEETFSRDLPSDDTLFAYVIEGGGYFDKEREPLAHDRKGENYFDFDVVYPVGPEHLIMFGEGDRLEVTGGDAGVRFLLVSGHPIGEPVAWYGPIVMNTQEELRLAFEEFRNGTFVKREKENFGRVADTR
jgi:redox-sensitive bicupin YhaK (pirin superfamily)